MENTEATQSPNGAAPIAAGTPFQFGDHTFQFGREVVELVDSSPLRHDPAALRARLATDGYLFMRGFHPRADALAAARWTLEAIARQGGLKAGSDVADGLIGAENRNFPFFRQVEVSHGAPILNVVDSHATFAFFEALFGKPVLTFDKRWLRCMAKGGHNHFHYDNVYVGRGTPNRVTVWTALNGAELDGGPLVIGLGSNRHRRLIETYGATDMDRDLTDAVFTADPRELVDDFGFTLATTRYQPGDAIIFGMFMMHSTAPNLSDRYRISIDTRYQPKDEAKDERFFFGEDGTWLGNFHHKGATYKPMSELRQEWGI
ncbi:MAG: phytanoyl-CoA dioxygenase family protein [Spirochaetaceae bacterium]|nr:phytanoyl-CoA dioxygenase family protein [Spirochaetaceae bacterium]